MMTSKTFLFRVLLLSLLVLMGAASLYAASPGDRPASAAGSTQPPATDFRGTWSGTFFSKHSNVAPFTMTVVINPDSRGHLIGSSSLNSECLKGAQLEVTVTSSHVVLAGSDEARDGMTLRATAEKTMTQVRANYILNG